MGGKERKKKERKSKTEQGRVYYASDFLFHMSNDVEADIGKLIGINTFSSVSDHLYYSC